MIKKGSVDVSGEGPFKSGSTISLEAKANGLYEFNGWINNETKKVVSKDNPYTFNINGNIDYVAKFNLRKSIELGSYPQSKVKEDKESALYNELKNVVGDVPLPDNLNGWRTYDDYYVDGFNNGKFYKNIFNNKDKYRAVYYFELDESKSDLNLVEKLDFFKFEPIEWSVLDDEGYLISKNILDRHMFYKNSQDRFMNQKTVYPSNYEYSDLRKFMNKHFLEFAFTINERSMILKDKVDNGIESTGYMSDEALCNDTYDKIFPVCLGELENVSTGLGLNNPKRKASVTDYSRCMGASSRYWTRTADFKYKNFAYCDIPIVGTKTDLVCSVEPGHCGVRPCMKINVDKFLNK